MTLTLINPSTDQVLNTMHSKSMFLFHAGITQWKTHFRIDNVVLGNPTELSITANDAIVGESIIISDVVGTTQLNGVPGIITFVSGTTIKVDIDSSLFSAYISGGNFTILRDHVPELSVRNSIKSKITGFKRVSASDMCAVIARIDWISGQLYEGYDPKITPVMPNYTIVDGNKLFICTVKGSAQSTSKPIHNNTDRSVMYPDGYAWLFSHVIDAEDIDKFGSVDWSPIRQNLVNETDAGQLLAIQVISFGSSYTHLDEINIIGDGTGANSRINKFTGSTGIDSVFIVDQGSNYTWAHAKVITSTGSGAELKPIISQGFKGGDLFDILKVKYLRFAVDHNGDENGALYLGEEYSFGLLQTENSKSDNVDMRLLLATEETGQLFNIGDEIIAQISGTIAVISGVSSSGIKVSEITGPGFIIGELVIGKNNMSAVINNIIQPENSLLDNALIVVLNNHASPVIRNSGQIDRYTFTIGYGS